MREIFLGVVAVCLILFSIIFPFRIAYLVNQPQDITVGPNQTYFWTSGKTLSRSLEGTFSLKSSVYFELRQEGKTPKQSVFEAPPIGENNGLYWIHDFSMSGTWENSSQAEIFSLEKNTFTVTSTFWDKFENEIIAIFACLMFLVISIWLLGWLDRLII